MRHPEKYYEEILDILAGTVKNDFRLIHHVWKERSRPSFGAALAFFTPPISISVFLQCFNFMSSICPVCRFKQIVTVSLCKNN